MRKTCIILFTFTLARAERDVLLELKGAYFLPTSTMFKNIYGNGSALYGPEVTFKLHRGLYGWLSIDFFTKRGHTLRNKNLLYTSTGEFCNVLNCGGYRTKIMFMPIAAGLKYLVPFCNTSGKFSGDFYLGLGVEPVYLHAKNALLRSYGASPYAKATADRSKGNSSAWGVGGIAKIGSYVNLPRNFLVDIFFDYSFAWAVSRRSRAKTDLSGCVFGLGVGYRFN